MVQKRKASGDVQRPQKRVRRESQVIRCLDRAYVDYPPLTSNASHPVLSRYFDTLVTLRKYMFPFYDNSRRYFIDRKGDTELLSLLDTTLVGVTQHPTRTVPKGDFSPLQSSNCQEEIVCNAIKLLFHRSKRSGEVRHTVYRGKPNNVLTQGFVTGQFGDPRVIHNNSGATTVSASLWNRLLEAVGEEAMLELLTDSSVFLLIDCRNGINNYNQVAGPPISDVLNTPAAFLKQAAVGKEGQRVIRSLGKIRIFRPRMFHAKPACTPAGKVQFGLGHIHVLNRFTNSENREHVTKILCYMFPRQFKLHNVFTSPVDRKEIFRPVKDYACRKRELAASEEAGRPLNIPKRLDGRAVELVAKMQRLHKRCSYQGLFEHYCPVLSGGNQNALRENFTDYASTVGEVAGFAKAVIRNVIPSEFWGNGNQNRDIVLRNVDMFVRLRRYESLSLHEIMHGLKLTNFAWLAPVNSPPSNLAAKLSLSDANKRKELLAEFIYWLFDSFLMPLLSSHFYISESNNHRNRIFFFRHDVWKRLSEPALEKLKTEMFEAHPAEKAGAILAQRVLGHSQARPLPKRAGIRLVMNLRRKGMASGANDKPKPSINSTLGPVYSGLSWERKANPALLGSSMFSVGDMYPKLKAFQAHLRAENLQNSKLYFVKVDIRGCFDSIPQEELVGLIDSVLHENQYLMTKYSALRPAAGWKVAAATARGSQLKPINKFVPEAKSNSAWIPFNKRLENELALGRRNAVFVDGVANKFTSKNDLMNLLKQHIRDNIVKIDNLFYRQKRGIPQGSILSTILCNFFYADMEKTKLPFTQDEDGVLLRLIDDFLFITLSREKATRFVEVMHAGNPEYGAFVSVQKTLVNFNVCVDGKKVERLFGTKEFPYCGNLINTGNLNVSKDRQRRVHGNLDDTLTVEYSKAPGLALHQKTLTSFSIQVQAAFFDTNVNSPATVTKNIYYNFVETAMKFHRGVKALSRRQRPTADFLVRVVSDLLDTACRILANIQKEGFTCKIGAEKIRRLGVLAFQKVLRRKHANYRAVLKWLDGRVQKKGSIDAMVSRFGSDPFEGFRY
ncbi:Telomerase reverse transcriptase [Rhizina undulata]